MKSSKRVTELNNRSVDLTDSELRFVDKFSVSLPMNELPEVVVIAPPISQQRVSHDTKSRQRQDSPSLHAIQQNGESQFKDLVETGPATVPFGAVQSDLNTATAADGNSIEKDALKQRNEEQNGHDQDETAEQIRDEADGQETYESEPVDAETFAQSKLDSQQRVTASDNSTDDLPEPSSEISTENIELPHDELDISISDSGDLDNRFADDTDLENTAAIYKIEDYAQHESKFERTAKSIEAELENKSSSVVLMTSPASVASNTSNDLVSSVQNSAANNLLSILANRNPTMRIISVQANECCDNEDERFSPGLGEVLSEENELDEVVIPTTIDNLDYLAFSDCGSVLSTSFKARAEKVLVELRKHYDLVFINGKTADAMETKSWSSLADATYLNVQLYRDDQAATIEATQQLRKCGGRLVGCIVIENE